MLPIIRNIPIIIPSQPRRISLPPVHLPPIDRPLQREPTDTIEPISNQVRIGIDRKAQVHRGVFSAGIGVVQVLSFPFTIDESVDGVGFCGGEDEGTILDGTITPASGEVVCVGSEGLDDLADVLPLPSGILLDPAKVAPVEKTEDGEGARVVFSFGFDGGCGGVVDHVEFHVAIVEIGQVGVIVAVVICISIVMVEAEKQDLRVETLHGKSDGRHC